MLIRLKDRYDYDRAILLNTDDISSIVSQRGNTSLVRMKSGTQFEVLESTTSIERMSMPPAEAATP